MANIINPEFGVKKDRLTLTSQDPNAVMYGVTPDSKFIPIKINDAGEIQIGGTINLEPGDIQIGAVEIKNYDTDDRVFVNVAHEMRVEARLHDGAGIDITSTSGALDINLKSGFVKDADDDSIAANQAGLQLGINLLYAYDGSSNWERLTQTGGSLNVNITAGGGPEDIDDGSIAGGQTTAMNSVLNYGWNGATWERITSSSNRLIIDGSGVTQPISAAALPLPAGAATQATLATLLLDATFISRINTLGQKAMVTSTPVVLPSNQSAIPVTQSGTWNLTDISGTISLPTGASTSALQTDGNLSLSNLDTKFDVILSTRASELTLSVLNGKVTAVDTGNVTVISTVSPPITGGHEILVRIASGTVPTTYGVTAQLVTTADRDRLEVRNDTNRTILISIAGTVDNFKLLNGEVGTWDNVAIPSGNTVRIRYDGQAPNTGEVTLTAWSDR